MQPQPKKPQKTKPSPRQAACQEHLSTRIMFLRLREHPGRQGPPSAFHARGEPWAPGSPRQGEREWGFQPTRTVPQTHVLRAVRPPLPAAGRGLGLQAQVGFCFLKLIFKTSIRVQHLPQHVRKDRRRSGYRDSVSPLPPDAAACSGTAPSVPTPEGCLLPGSRAPFSPVKRLCDRLPARPPLFGSRRAIVRDVK